MSNTRNSNPHAARAEATGSSVEIPYNGYTYKIPPSSEWDIEAIEAAENGRIIASTRMILGDEQWAEFRKHNRTMGDLDGFMDKLTELTGGNL